METAIETGASIPKAALAVAILLLASHGYGLLVLPTSDCRGRLSRDGWIVRVAAGLCLIAAVAMLIGLSRNSNLYSNNAILFVGLIANAGLIHKETWTAFERWMRSTLRSSSRLPCWSLFGISLLTLGPALCIPDGWDELVYHHELPKRWQRDGWLAIYPDLPYSGFPSLAETLFWLVNPIEGVIVPRLLSWSSWILGIIAMFRFLRQRLDEIGATVLTAAISMSPVLLLTSQNCYVESVQFFLFNSTLLLIGAPKRPATQLRSGRVALSIGILLGGIMGVKLTGISVSTLILFWVVCDAILARFQRRSLAYAVLVATGMLALAFPFYLRPWLFTGNPTYPYFADWFGADETMRTVSAYHHHIGASFGLHSSNGLVFAPFLQAVVVDLYDGGFGYQLIVLIAICIGGLWMRGLNWMDRRTLLNLVSCILLYGFWFFTAQQARFAIALVTLIAVCASQHLCIVSRQSRRLYHLSIVFMTLISFPYGTIGYYAATWGVVTRVVPPIVHLTEGTRNDYVKVVGYLNNQPSTSRTLLLYEHRSFYLKNAAEIATPEFQVGPFTGLDVTAGYKLFCKTLLDTQTTHLVIARTPTGPDEIVSWERSSNTLLQYVQTAISSRFLSTVWESEHYWVFQINPS